MEQKNITYTKYTAEDFGLFESLFYDSDIMLYVTGKALTKAEASAKFGSILAINDSDENLGCFKVYDSNNEFLGDCKLEWSRHDSTKLEIGYIVKKDYWGQGYGTRICTDMLSLANVFFPEVSIIGLIDPANIASKRLLEKFGFESYFIGEEDGLPTEKLILKRPTA